MIKKMVKAYKILFCVFLVSLVALIVGVLAMSGREELPGFMGVLLFLCMLLGAVFIIGSVILFAFEIKTRWKERKQYALYEILKEIMVMVIVVVGVDYFMASDEFRFGQCLTIALMIPVISRATSYVRELEKKWKDETNYI